MTNRKDLPKPFGDIEKRHETVADSFSDGLGTELSTVRLGDMWSDLIRVADERRDPDTPPRPPSAVPLLDDMKGILQWD
jgi:hypothetical protein